MYKIYLTDGTVRDVRGKIDIDNNIGLVRFVNNLNQVVMIGNKFIEKIERIEE